MNMRIPQKNWIAGPRWGGGGRWGIRGGEVGESEGGVWGGGGGGGGGGG
jgi:hypothetical protein